MLVTLSILSHVDSQVINYSQEEVCKLQAVQFRPSLKDHRRLKHLPAGRMKEPKMTVRGTMVRSEAGMSDIIARVSFLIFSHYLANIVYRDIKAISRDFIRYFCSNYRVVFNWRPSKLHILTQKIS